MGREILASGVALALIGLGAFGVGKAAGAAPATGGGSSLVGAPNPHPPRCKPYRFPTRGKPLRVRGNQGLDLLYPVCFDPSDGDRHRLKF